MLRKTTKEDTLFPDAGRYSLIDSEVKLPKIQLQLREAAVQCTVALLCYFSQVILRGRIMAIILIIRVLITEVTRMTARKVWHGTLKVLHNFLSLRGALTQNREP